MTLFALLIMGFLLQHFIMSATPVRRAIAARIGDKGFLGLYSLLSLILLGGAIWVYRGLAVQPLWVAPGWAWPVSALLMLIASILFVGSFGRANAALPGAKVASQPPVGVLAITRHPMLWSFAIWAGVHGWLSGSAPTVLLTIGIGVLALLGAAHQDQRKLSEIGEPWRQYVAHTSYWPFGAQLRGRRPWAAAWPGLAPLLIGLFFWLLLTFLHPALLGAPTVPPWGLW